MKFFSICSDCLTCACSGGCLAGHGDDDYVRASNAELKKRLDKYENILRNKTKGWFLEHVAKDYERLCLELNLKPDKDLMDSVKNE